MNTADSTVFNPCILVPVYNHSAVLKQLLTFVHDKGLPVVMVDDGSEPACRDMLVALKNDIGGIHLVKHDRNAGKGAAVKTGLFEAYKMHFTHALQIDADGQHDTGDIERFLEQARASPGALVAGHPVYDASVPKLRFYCRYLSHVLVWVNTLSMTIIDSMCGFRVYPLQRSCALLRRHRVGNRMDFDGEFIVRWYWAGYPLVQLPTRVIYPPDGISHFRYLPDNILIAWMHTKLFVLMLLQSPLLLARKFYAPARRR